MTTILFEAQPYDEAKARRRRLWIGGIIAVVLAVSFFTWWFRHWPEETRVDKFFAQLEQKNFEHAYAIWMNDPNWKQHPEQYKRYTFGEFYNDWGPGGEWGLIKNHKVEGSATPRGGSSGIVVVTRVNNRAEKSCLWVEKSDKTLHFSSYKTNDCS